MDITTDMFHFNFLSMLHFNFLSWHHRASEAKEIRYLITDKRQVKFINYKTMSCWMPTSSKNHYLILAQGTLASYFTICSILLSPCFT